MTTENSYRTILRSSSIIGGASVVNVLAGIAKMKAAALLLGPAGVGLVGLYMNLMQTAATISALGLGNAGTRQIAAANAEDSQDAVGRTRRALFWGTMILAILGGAIFWLLSGWIARDVLDDPSRSSDVAWLAVGVALTVAAGSQAALLTGLRRIGDIARISVIAGIFSSALGVLALWVWGLQGLIVMVLIAPAITFLSGLLFTMRLGAPAGPPAPFPEVAREWKNLARLGVAFMISGVITLIGHLAVRTLVQRELGTDALGQFQAAWMIGMTYLGFVLGAMGTDYYPRLTAAIHDGVAATRLINEQTDVALLLCAPALLAMLGLAPWVIQLLYSAEFGPAVEILRWQLLGDILKVMSWPLAFVLLASGAGKTFLMTETTAITVLLLGVFFGLPLIGVTATGIAFLVHYVVYLPLVWWLARRRIDFSWSRAVKVNASLIIAAAVVVEIAARWSNAAGAFTGITLAAILGLSALIRLAEMSAATGRLAGLASLGKRLRTVFRDKA